MIYLRLFTAFIKIGFTSFGGMSMIPVIMQEMKVNQWMTAEDLTNLIAIAEMTPGPLGINCATFAGMQTADVLGGIAAVMGVLMPAYTLTLGVAVCFAKFRGNDIYELYVKCDQANLHRNDPCGDSGSDAGKLFSGCED